MKALIITGGFGNRLRPYTEEINKCAIPVGGKPLIDYSLDICRNLAKYHLIEREVIVVTGYRENDIWKLHKGEYDEISVRYRNQLYPQAIGAIKAAEDLLDDTHFLLMLGDEVMIKPNHNEMFKKFYNSDYDGVVGYVSDTINMVKKTYAIYNDRYTTSILKLEEKPKLPPNRMVGTGNCILPTSLLHYIPKEVDANFAAGDFVSIVDKMIQCEKKKFSYCKIAKKYVNVNTIADLHRAERYLKDE